MRKKIRNLQHEIESGCIPSGYSLKWEDVGHVLGDLGHVLLVDVGKRIFLHNGILQMENAEQRDNRSFYAEN